jgi:hypothetical protein
MAVRTLVKCPSFIKLPCMGKFIRLPREFPCLAGFAVYLGMDEVMAHMPQLSYRVRPAVPGRHRAG